MLDQRVQYLGLMLVLDNNQRLVQHLAEVHHLYKYHI
jgi:hypothetical protein